MRFSLILLAAATGFVAAQNDTDTDAPPADVTTDFDACSVQCSNVVLAANPAVGAKCEAQTTADAQTLCICESSKVVNDLQTCLDTTCPALMDGVDMQQTCDVLTGKKPIPGTEKPDNGALGTATVGAATFLTAAGALFAGALLF